MFCQQVANNPSTDWSKLNSSLYAVNFLTNQNGWGKICQHYFETDHLQAKCALASVKADRASSMESIGDDARTSRSEERGCVVFAIINTFDQLIHASDYLP